MKLLERVAARLASPKKRADFVRRQGVRVGSGCEIYPTVSFGSEPYMISLGDRVRVTDGVRFVTHDGGVWVLRTLQNYPEADIFGEIKVGSNVHIGVNSVIMPGITIGDNVIVGAGSVVSRDIPSNSVAAGVPARVIKSIDEYVAGVSSRIVATKSMPGPAKRAFLETKPWPVGSKATE